MKIDLAGGFYVAKSIIAGAQRACNLYAEKNAQDSPFPYTSYQCPGLRIVGGPSQFYNPITYGQLFDSGVASCSLIPNVKAIWSDQRNLVCPGMQVGKYTTAYRCGSQPTSWFLANHPDWILRKADGSIAYEFGDTTQTPIDFTNPAAAAFKIAEIAASLNGQNWLSIDNVSANNQLGHGGYGNYGYLSGSTLVQLYTATDPDAAWIAANLAWIQTLTTWAHGQGLKVMINNTYAPATDWQNLVNEVDGVLLEGFVVDVGTFLADTTFDNEYALLLPNGGIPTWLPSYSAGATPTEAETLYASAAYLLLLQGVSYFSLTQINAAGPQSYGAGWPLGAPLGPPPPAGSRPYYRQFQGGWVALNPSSTTSYPVPGSTQVLAPLTAAIVATVAGGWRCLYRASTGDLYGVLGSAVCYIDPTWTIHVLGTIAPGTGIVSMADNRLVIVIVDGTTSGYYIDLTKARAFGSIVAAAFYGADRVDYIDTFFVFNQPATANFYVSAPELTAGLIVGGGVLTGTIAKGVGYSNGIHAAVPLTGGTGTGALADITVGTNGVTSVTVTTPGIGYLAGDILSADPVTIGGGITGQVVIGGVGYTPGTYTGINLTGGTGSLAQATIVVGAGGIVTTVTITAPGQDYAVNDQLSASSATIGGTGAGLIVQVTGVNITGSGFTYTVATIDIGSGAFNPLDIAAKSGASDILVSFIAIHREIWLIGALTSEVWYDAGTPDFSFGELPGVFIEHGCVAKYSLAKADLSSFWLGQDLQGNCIVFKGAQYLAQRISTSALENVLQGYSTVSDAIGFTYQQDGHVFYFLTFPSADATWVYDLQSELWHERTWTDLNGGEHRHRANCAAFAYGVNVVGDWQNDSLYALDPTLQTDAGQPIVFRRGFPQLLNEGKRLSYDRFVLEMDVGRVLGTIDPGPPVFVRFSDSKGRSFGNPIPLSVGATGEDQTSMQARQLGMGRDRVFEVFWTGSYPTALSGAWVDASPAET